ncbi:MAG TPA: DUF4199 family protein [Bacteroidetes bacterium]|nr:DUF4199 family protein [Bacteroidota bacterium]HIL57764.1 DUF4199 family protein [Rhodothermales bacterium]
MPSKSQSILIGIGTSVILGLALAFVASNAGTIGQSLAGCFSCLVALAAPMVAVWHYTSTYNLTIPAGQGAGMGAAVGAGGAVLGGVLQQLLISIGVFPDPVQRVREMYEAQGMSAEDIEQMMGMMEMFSSPVMGIVLGLVIGALVGAIGGAIGAAIFKKGGADDYEV